MDKGRKSMDMLDVYRKSCNALREENKRLRENTKRKDTAMFLMLIVVIIAIPLVGLLK
jgi:CHASE3 domain sensor protein